MALSNFSLPFGAAATPSPSNWLTTASPIQHHVTAVNDLLYSPEGHQPADRSNGSPSQYYKNDPYAPPTQPPSQYQRQQTYQYRSHNNYLPPPIPVAQNPAQLKSQHIPQLQAPPPPPPPSPPARTITNYQSHHQTRTYGENSYESHEFYSENISNSYNNSDSNSQPSYPVGGTPQPQLSNEHLTNAEENGYPAERPTYTRVQAGQGSKTQVHAVLDYDNDDYYDDTGERHF